MKLKLVAFLFTLMLVGSLQVMTAQAWVAGSYSSGWTTRTHSAWLSEDDGTSSYFIHNTTAYTTFQSWGAIMKLKDFRIGGVWGFSTMSQIYNITLTDGTHTITLYIEHWTKLFLFGSTSAKTDFNVYYDGTAQIINNPYTMKHVDVEAYLYKSSATELSFSVLMDIFKWNQTFAVGAGWFADIDIFQRVDKSLVWGAVGFIQGEKVGESLTTGAGYIPDPAADYTPYTYAEGYYRMVMEFLDDVANSFSGFSGVTTYTVTLLDPVNGTLSLAVGNYTVNNGDYFRVSAYPSENYTFSHWLINNVSTVTGTPLNLLISNDTSVQAVYSVAVPSSTSFMSSLIALTVPLLIIGTVGVGFTGLISGHPVGLFLTGGAIGLLVCAQAGLIPMWIMILLFTVGMIGFFFWFRSGD